MPEERPYPTAVVLTRYWGGTSEPSFVLRSIAGALSRYREVGVVSLDRGAKAGADGLFDVRPGPRSTEVESWVRETSESSEPILPVVDGADEEAVRLARALIEGQPSAGRLLKIGRGAALDPFELGLYVPVNALAATSPHNGFGFTGYVLVLTDRICSDDESAGGAHDPSPASRWLIARFPRLRILVVDAAEARAYWGRALRGIVHIDTRTDLQRLMAHASVTVDLRPGPLIGRECVESLLFGTPIVVPAGSAAGRIAAAGGGLWFDDVAELLGCVEAMSEPAIRDVLGGQGRELATARFGDPERFVKRVHAASDQLGA